MTINDSNEANRRELFSTFDLGLASALVSKGFPLKSLENTKGGKTRFIFLGTPDIENAAGEYWNNNLKVCARTFFENQKMLKNRIYSDQI